jgi:curved DNA-binding protein CbpA
MEKEEFVVKYRELIKKYHPDHCDDEGLRKQNAEIAVRLNAAYERYKNEGRRGLPADAGEAGRESAEPQAPGTAAQAGAAAWHEAEARSDAAARPATGGILVLKNQDYLYYRLGIEYYRKFHPSTWSKYFILVSRIDPAKHEYSKKIKAIEEIFINLNLALFCFRKVASEFPGSQWAYDSGEKITFLKKMMKTYEAIWKNVEESEFSADMTYRARRRKPGQK